MDGNFSGMGVHEAARIAALANGGEIVARKSTVAGNFQVTERGSETWKGITEPVEVVSVAWK